MNHSDKLVQIYYGKKLLCYTSRIRPPGGGTCPTGMCRFSGYRFIFFLELGIKRRQFFRSRLSKHVKGGNFVRSGYYLVKCLCFLSILFIDFFFAFSRIRYHLKAKFLEPGKFCRGHIPVHV